MDKNEKRKALNAISDSLTEIYIKLTDLHKEEIADERKERSFFSSIEHNRAASDNLLEAFTKIYCAQLEIQEALEKLTSTSAR